MGWALALFSSGTVAAALGLWVLRLMSRVHVLNERLAERSSKLHAFAVELIRAEEDQRSRIARELHDGLGQLMTAVNIELKVLRDAAPAELLARVDDVSALSAQVMAEMRRISQELRPAILDEMGLGEAVRALVRRLERHLQIELVLEGRLEVLPADAAIACYRLVQEALNNVVRHSGAKRAWVKLARHDDRLEVEVSDDGKGIDYDPAAKLDGHFGLMGLEQRISAIGGSFRFGKSEHGGATVAATIPV
jgi:two-component system, NarL family, sensor histidine kinase UhpB